MKSSLVSVELTTHSGSWRDWKKTTSVRGWRRTNSTRGDSVSLVFLMPCFNMIMVSPVWVYKANKCLDKWCLSSVLANCDYHCGSVSNMQYNEFNHMPSMKMSMMIRYWLISYTTENKAPKHYNHYNHKNWNASTQKRKIFILW